MNNNDGEDDCDNDDDDGNGNCHNDITENDIMYEVLLFCRW